MARRSNPLHSGPGFTDPGGRLVKLAAGSTRIGQLSEDAAMDSTTCSHTWYSAPAVVMHRVCVDCGLGQHRHDPYSDTYHRPADCDRERGITARCGRTDPHGGHWAHAIGRPCVGNVNVVSAMVARLQSGDTAHHAVTPNTTDNVR